MEPESRLIHQELARVREKAREEAESEKSLYRKMLGIKKDYMQEDQRYPVIKSVSAASPCVIILKKTLRGCLRKWFE